MTPEEREMVAAIQDARDEARAGLRAAERERDEWHDACDKARDERDEWRAIAHAHEWRAIAHALADAIDCPTCPVHACDRGGKPCIDSLIAWARAVVDEIGGR
jgi:hypothetical protein